MRVRVRPMTGVTSDRISVAVYASDPLAAAGISAILNGDNRIDVTPRGKGPGPVDVVVLASESITQDFLNTLRGHVNRGASGLVTVLEDQVAVDMVAEHDLGVLSRTAMDE